MIEHLRAITGNFKRTGGGRFSLKRSRFFRPDGIGVKKANQRLVTFVFTRHPFDRFVSAYNDLIFIDGGACIKCNVNIYKWRADILLKYSHITATNFKAYPAPKEFVQYHIELSSKTDPSNFNHHVRPQYLACPFCAIKFDLIADIANMNSKLKLLSDKLGFKVSFKGLFA